MVKKFLHIINIPFLGIPLYLWFIFVGFGLNTINYALGYPFSEAFGWVLKGIGTVFFVYHLFK